MKTNEKNGQSGAALVEFTLVVPLLLIFLFGIIEFSLLLYDKAVVTNASREAAREWIVYRGDTLADKLDLADIQNIVDNYTSKRLITFGDSVPTVVTDPSESSGPIDFDRGDSLKVTVNYEYDFLLLPGLARNLMNSVSLTAETTMRAE